jgi:hypothetical protein
MASEFAVLIAAAGVLPASQRAEWSTNPCESVPETPAMAAPLVDDDVEGTLVDVVAEGVLDGAVDDGVEADGTVDVTVVIDGGGAARGVDGPVLLLPPVKTTTMASNAARANVDNVPANNAACPLLIRDRLGVGGGGAGM